MNEEAEVQRGLREFDAKKHKQMRPMAMVILALFIGLGLLLLLPLFLGAQGADHERASVIIGGNPVAETSRPAEIIRVSVRYDPALVRDAASAAMLCKSVGESVAMVNDYYSRSGINTRLEVVCPPFREAFDYARLLATTRLLTGAMFEEE